MRCRNLCFLQFSDHLSEAADRLSFPEFHGAVGRIVGVQPILPVFLDVSFIVHQEDSDFPEPKLLCMLYQYPVPVIIGGFHTVSANGDHFIRLLRLVIRQEQDLFTLGLSQRGSETGGGTQVVPEQGNHPGRLLRLPHFGAAVAQRFHLPGNHFPVPFFQGEEQVQDSPFLLGGFEPGDEISFASQRSYLKERMPVQLSLGL